MDIAICLIIKNENLYLREWVKYYKDLGAAAIILYDNNDINGEYPQQVIGDYVADGFVKYHDVRGKYRYQLEAYGDCCAMYRDKYDWICFFDTDEYLTFSNNQDINGFFGQDVFKDETVEMLAVYWSIYGDNNLLHYDGRPMFERFTTPKEHSDAANTYKMCLRGKGSKLWNITWLDANMLTYYYPEGSKVNTLLPSLKYAENLSLYQQGCWDNVVLNHYNTLTIEEFLYRRFCRRGYADMATDFNKDRVMKIFYDINEITSEKEAIINEFFSKFNFNEDNING
jgi:hypothetical protein